MATRRRFLILGLILAGSVLAVLTVHLETASRFDREALSPRAGPVALDRHDRILRLVPDARGRKVLPAMGEALPPQVAAAFIAAEDQRFWVHPGVDTLAVGRAFLSNLTAGRIVSGASTITQQLARLAYPGPRTYYRKLVEMLRSLRIEATLAKEEILKLYLDQVPLGNNLVGVEAAAQAYFLKKASQLTAAEAATLAALVKAPGTLNPLGPHRTRLLARRDRILARMAQAGALSTEELHAARSQMVQFHPARLPFAAPHLVELVLPRPGQGAISPGPIRTTLDLDLQRRAEQVLAAHRVRLQSRGASQAAAVILGNRTVEVLALVGSCQYGPRDRGYNNGATSWRSPGSTLKPFLYGQALDLGLTPASVVDDVERRYATPRGEFLPANFDRATHGPVSFREALGNSLNLAAVSLLHRVGPGTFYDILSRLNLVNHPERGPDHYGLGLVVGNPEVSLLQLAAAYACLANGGLFRPARLRLDEAPGEGVRVFSPQAAYLVSDILADSMARSRIFGASTAMNPPYRLALKTGTSTHYRDCWAVAYTPEYTVAVWVGNFDGRPTAKLSGAEAAAPILADLAAQLFSARSPASFTRPTGITTMTVCTFSGLPPGAGCAHVREELFLDGTEPQETCTYHQVREPWHRMPTQFAGWLHRRHQKAEAGRFRLAGFHADLDRTFSNPEPSLRKTAPASGVKGKLTLGLAPARRLLPALPPSRSPVQEPPVAIVYPLPGDRYLLSPPAETLRLTLKAECHVPLPAVTWFLDGREYADTGPPYELSLDLSRGRHRLMAVGPDGRGDAVDIAVE